MPDPSHPPRELQQDVCLQLLDHLGDQVCAMIRQEQEALEIEASFPAKKYPTGWKRLVEGIREMCDVCATTLFNYHWICGDCGFVACLECFKSRKAEKKRVRS
jgi:lysine-specific demethylase 3